VFKAFPLTCRFVLWVAAPALIGLTAVFIYLRGSLGTSDAPLTLTAAQGSAQVTRDRNGVVYITATRDEAAFFAVGFMHAQDRMWQLEVQRRLAQGRMSEVFGRSAIRQDAWMRTLDLYGAARSAWPALSADARASLTAYADGINAWLATDPVLPPEFQALNVRPQQWRALDSLAWSKVFALDLANNMETEITRLIASQYLDDEQLAELLGIRHGDIPPGVATRVPALRELLAGLDGINRHLSNELRIGGRYVGSNAWVVSGALTQTGRPLLANDPHLGLQIPSPWYVAKLAGQHLDATGMTLVGLPVVIFGRNADIAWGGTSLMADVQDLYLEQIDPADPRNYQTENGWQPFVAREEKITVRADFPEFLREPLAPVTVRVRVSRNGPLISDVLQRAGTADHPVALRWTALEPGDTSYEAFFRLNYARDWRGFQDALGLLVAPALNFLYADNQGNIGSQAAGRIPVRARGTGRIPSPGWTDEFRWQANIPSTQMPGQYNPSSGYIVSANNDIAGADYPHFISADFAPPFRAKRIEQLLMEGRGESALTAAYMQRMQSDTVDLGTLRLLDHLKRTVPDDDSQRSALEHLRNWHGDMSVDSVGAVIFFVWAEQLREEIFATRMARYWNKPEQAPVADAIARHATYDVLLNALTDSSSQWCRPGEGASTRPCAAELHRALDRTIRELNKLMGSQMSKWRWGEAHTALYAHKPFSSLQPLASLFERRVPSGGSSDTINAANASYRESSGYEQTIGPSFRQVIEMAGERSGYWYVNSTGQSGNMLSPHYDDMITPWREGRYFELNGSALR
jgi:penicillin G amidase